MAGYQPYQKNYLTLQKKRKLYSILIPVILIAFVTLFFMTRPKIRKDDEGINPVKTDSHALETKKAASPEPDSFPSGQKARENLYPQPETRAEPQGNGNAGEPLEPAVDEGKTIPRKPQPEEEWESEIDLEREQGMAIFEDAIGQCADTRERVRELQMAYKNTCTGTVIDAFGNLIFKSTTEECLRLRNQIDTLNADLKRNLNLARENARKAGVYPGQIRDILEKYGFENL